MRLPPLGMVGLAERDGSVTSGPHAVIFQEHPGLAAGTTEQPGFAPHLDHHVRGVTQHTADSSPPGDSGGFGQVDLGTALSTTHRVAVARGIVGRSGDLGPQRPIVHQDVQGRQRGLPGARRRGSGQQIGVQRIGAPLTLDPAKIADPRIVAEVLAGLCPVGLPLRLVKWARISLMSAPCNDPNRPYRRHDPSGN